MFLKKKKKRKKEKKEMVHKHICNIVTTGLISLFSFPIKWVYSC